MINIMNTFYIIANHLKVPCLEQAETIKKILEEMGKVCYVQDDALVDPEMYKYAGIREVPPDVECVLVLGGDGTLLRASRALVNSGLPLLGINMGTLGYLAEIEQSGIPDALEKIARGDFTIEKRMMLTGSVVREGKMLLRDLALNDIVISRSGELRVLDFAIYVDDSFLCGYRADGVIVATATGSTGYSLSAGGPIVSPDAFLMLLTAISPHTLTSRPIVLPDQVQIRVQLAGRAAVTFDGDTSLQLLPGDQVYISRADAVTNFIKINHTSFVELLRRKMN